MEDRQTPKCFRQIGQSADAERVYIEDYVKSYLHNISETQMEEGCIVALYGVWQRQGASREWYLEGAARLSVGMNRLYPGVEETICEEIEAQRKKYFEELQFVGWFFLMPAVLSEENVLYETLSREWFPGQDICFVSYQMFDALLHAYVMHDNTFEEQPGYYVYYEKNTPMQEYMIATQNHERSREQLRETAVEAIRARFREAEAEDSCCRSVEARWFRLPERQGKKKQNEAASQRHKKDEKLLPEHKPAKTEVDGRELSETMPQESEQKETIQRKQGKKVSALTKRVLARRKRVSKLSTATTIATLTFIALLATFLYLQHDNMDQVAEAMQAFAKSISPS